MPHPDYLEALLTPQQLNDWVEYHNNFGDVTNKRHDSLLASLVKMYYDSHKGKNAPNIEYEDFLPYRPQREPQTPQQGLAIIRTAKRLAKHR